MSIQYQYKGNITLKMNIVFISVKFFGLFTSYPNEKEKHRSNYFEITPKEYMCRIK